MTCLKSVNIQLTLIDCSRRRSSTSQRPPPLQTLARTSPQRRARQNPKPKLRHQRTQMRMAAAKARAKPRSPGRRRTRTNPNGVFLPLCSSVKPTGRRCVKGHSSALLSSCAAFGACLLATKQGLAWVRFPVGWFAQLSTWLVCHGTDAATGLYSHANFEHFWNKPCSWPLG